MDRKDMGQGDGCDELEANEIFFVRAVFLTDKQHFHLYRDFSPQYSSNLYTFGLYSNLLLYNYNSIKIRLESTLNSTFSVITH